MNEWMNDLSRRYLKIGLLQVSIKYSAAASALGRELDRLDTFLLQKNWREIASRCLEARQSHCGLFSLKCKIQTNHQKRSLDDLTKFNWNLSESDKIAFKSLRAREREGESNLASRLVLIKFAFGFCLSAAELRVLFFCGSKQPRSRRVVTQLIKFAQQYLRP